MCSSMRQKYIYFLFLQSVRSGWREISTRVKTNMPRVSKLLQTRRNGHEKTDFGHEKTDFEIRYFFPQTIFYFLGHALSWGWDCEGHLS